MKSQLWVEGRQQSSRDGRHTREPSTPVVDSIGLGGECFHFLVKCYCLYPLLDSVDRVRFQDNGKFESRGCSASCDRVFSICQSLGASQRLLCE